jgi:preprotein translocase subunit SecD
MRRSMSVSLLAVVAFAVVALGATLLSSNTPKLGLDLQGGAAVVLTPSPGQSVRKGALDEAVRIIRQRVNGLGVSEANVAKQGNNVVVEMPGVKNQDQALKLVGATAQLEFRPVLQTTGAAGVYDPITGNIVNQGATTTVKPGTTSTTTRTSGPAATTTTRPVGTSTTKGALGGRRLSQVAAAAVTPAQEATPPTSASASPSSTPPTSASASPSSTPATSTPTTAPPATTAPSASSSPQLTPKDNIKPDQTVILPQLTTGTNDIVAIYQVGPAELTGSAVSDANAQLSTQLGSGWEVKVTFTGSGGPKFDALAKKYYQKQVAIVLDGVVISAPTINAQQFNGVAVITGNSSNGGFTHHQANDLSLVLRYGALPVKLDQQTVTKVSATLGKDTLRAGLAAGILGLILVLLYMIAYYRALGLVVLVGLSVSAALMYSIVTYLGTTSFGLALSLAGVTGIVVSVGVTVDSYIVYFERLKDEIRAGRSVRASVDRGFGRAWRTILSADAVSFIGAFLLWWLSVGQVRGFAFFLGLSTLLDLLVAYTFTRPMVVLLGRNRTFTQARFFGVARGLAVGTAGGGS